MLEIRSNDVALQLRTVEGIEAHLSFVQGLSDLEREGIEMLVASFRERRLFAEIGEHIVAGHPDEALVSFESGDMTRHPDEVLQSILARTVSERSKLNIRRRPEIFRARRGIAVHFG